MEAPSHEEVTKFLQDHRLCVFATGRKDGSPQQSYIGYQYDGKQFLLGGQATSFKMKNLARNPGCSLVVTDGRIEIHGTHATFPQPMYATPSGAQQPWDVQASPSLRPDELAANT